MEIGHRLHYTTENGLLSTKPDVSKVRPGTLRSSLTANSFAIRLPKFAPPQNYTGGVWGLSPKRPSLLSPFVFLRYLCRFEGDRQLSPFSMELSGPVCEANNRGISRRLGVSLKNFFRVGQLAGLNIFQPWSLEMTETIRKRQRAQAPQPFHSQEMHLQS